MSASQQNFRTVLFSLVGALAVAMMSCAEPRTDGAAIALQVAPGVTLTVANYWIIAPDGTVTTGTVAVGNSSTVRVITLPPKATGYQLIVSGLASDQITGCSGSTTFNSPTPTTGVPVTLTCAGPPAPGQVLVTATVDICPIIDGVAASPSSIAVGNSMALQVIAHDPDSGPLALSYSWSANGVSLTSSPAASATFACTEPGTFNISVAASDGEPTCVVAQTFTVTCTEL
jgi:hypothetical protein